MGVHQGRLGAAIAIATLLATVSACATKTAKRSGTSPERDMAETFTPSPMPTVPPSGTTRTPTPEGIRTPVRQPKPGEPIGPDITFFGITRADGNHVEPVSVDAKGVPTYENYVGSGFQIVVEAKPGISGYDVGQRVFAYSPDDPTMQPDLQIQVTRPLGDGSAAVCDRMRPNIGGVPALDPPSFKQTRRVTETLNDLSCRFELFLDTESACSLSKNGDWAYKSKDTKIQFCMMVAKAWNFPVGKTLVSMRLHDRAGNPGAVKKMWINRPKMAATPRPKPTLPPTPKSLPTR